MNYRPIGTAGGRDVYLFVADEDAAGAAPAGFSVAAAFLDETWTAADLSWMLNALYGGLADWNDFDRSRGARSFAFFGPRADDASALCDALAFAWSQGSDALYESIMASSHDEDSEYAFVENLLGGEILCGETYSGQLANLVFAVAGAARADALEPVIRDAVSRYGSD